MANQKEIRDLVGQMFLVGFDGHTVPDEFRKFIHDYHLGGTIYFKRNAASPKQLAELSNEIQFSCRRRGSAPLFISIDHEGGVVNRLSSPFTKFPECALLGEIGSPKLAFEFGVVLAKELRAVGININYSPVVDVNSNPDSPVIGTRAFSNDPEVCGRMGSAVCRGLQKMGVMAVAKHFPGHGDTKEDSHFHLPKLNKPLSELEKLELIPFRRLVRSRVDGIMTAHIINTALDPEFTATMSEYTLQTLLRNELRYNRLIFSDDLEMKAIADHFGVAKAACLAVKAGCDILIYRGDPGPPIEAFEAICEAVSNKEIPFEKIHSAAHRIAVAKKTYCTITEPIDVSEVENFIGLPEHAKLAEQIRNKQKPAKEDESD